MHARFREVGKPHTCICFQFVDRYSLEPIALSGARLHGTSQSAVKQRRPMHCLWQLLRQVTLAKCRHACLLRISHVHSGRDRLEHKLQQLRRTL